MPSNKTQLLPYNLTNYIDTHFREDFLFEVKNIIEVDGHKQYEVEVAKDDYIYTLLFDEQGNLLRESAEEAYPSRDDDPFGEIPV